MQLGSEGAAVIPLPAASPGQARKIQFLLIKRS